MTELSVRAVPRLGELYPGICLTTEEKARKNLTQGACTHTGFLPESDPDPVVGFFTRTGITAAGGQFDIERCTLKITPCRFHTEVFKTVAWHRQVQISRTKKMLVHRNRKRNLLVLLYLRRKYKKRERQYWIHPVLAVRYLEGSFYTLFEKLKSHDSKFFNYFRMSVSTFEFLVMRLSDRIKGQDTPMRACVPPKEMLAVTIR